VVVELRTEVYDDAMGQPVVMHELIQEVEYSVSLWAGAGLTSIHLVNLSMATKTLLNPPNAVGKGPIMLSPQQAKG
jgi:hypothetical protein